jgi:primary-amine oxidase
MQITYRSRLFLAVLLSYCSTSTSAHEFWVSPEQYNLKPGAPIVGTLRVGEMTQGVNLPYVVDNFHSFNVTTKSGTQAVKGADGSTPALSHPTQEAGLHVITYHAKAILTTYNDWQKFLDYLGDEGLDSLATTHQRRGLPKQGFTERYSRYAKALVQVGPVDKQERDVAQGVPFELIAEDNPYTPGLETMSVTLLRAGVPVSGHQIAVFHYDGMVSRTLFTTDGQGRASIPIAAGGSFLLNATDLQPVDEADVVWESYWASLTFGLPVRLDDLHPLDPLRKIEINRAVRVIGKSGYADAKTRVAFVGLAEPDKAAVLAWTPGKPITRKAFAIVRNGPRVFEAVIDLASGTLESWQALPDTVQPAIQSAEWRKAQRLLKQDPRWIAAMRARGYTDFSDIFCESHSAGFFDLAEERKRRLLKMPCYDIRGAKTNIYGRPIEGLISVVDLNEWTVVEVIDKGPVPVSTDNHGFDEASVPVLRDAMRPVQTQVPAGWNFQADGRRIDWQAWSFHVGFDQRFGVQISLVTHRDNDERRMILYRGHLSEIYVPYMDTSEAWYHRAYMDSGEYGLGIHSSPLAPGRDCPDNALFFDAELVDPLGMPRTRQRLVCIFERDAGAPLWRHWEAYNGAHEARPATELVVRSIPSIGNYDYIVDWVFTQAGELQINIGATGIDAVKGVNVRSMKDVGAEQETVSGMLVAPNLVAVHHDHYFSIRLDIDVDGPINNFVRERLTPVSAEKGTPRRSLWRLARDPMPREGAITARTGPELWRIENSARTTTLGHKPSYQLVSTSNATSLLDKNDWPQRRAAFSAETLWITARQPGELFAAGPYPNQARGGDGLPAYVNGEPVVGTDLVAWYTLGFHHLTRPEDWPVLPTVWHTLRLRPYGFFEKNPAVGLRRDFQSIG